MTERIKAYAKGWIEGEQDKHKQGPIGQTVRRRREYKKKRTDEETDR